MSEPSRAVRSMSDMQFSDVVLTMPHPLMKPLVIGGAATPLHWEDRSLRPLFPHKCYLGGKIAH